MKKITLLLALLGGGCKSMNGGLTVAGSAYVEADRPEGKAVAKIEVRYTPLLPSPREEVAAVSKAKEPLPPVERAEPALRQAGKRDDEASAADREEQKPCDKADRAEAKRGAAEADHITPCQLRRLGKDLLRGTTAEVADQLLRSCESVGAPGGVQGMASSVPNRRAN